MITRSKDLDFFSTLIKLQNLGAVFMIVSFVSLQTLCKAQDASNAELLNQLSQAEQRQLINGFDSTKIEELPRFSSKYEELKWKLNKAKKTLHKARQIENLAKKAAVHFGYYKNAKQKHSDVSDLLSNAEHTLLEAGDKFGFDYQKF